MNTFECNLCGGKGEHLHWCPRSVDSWSASIPMTGTWGDAATALARSGVELKVETIEDVLRDAAANDIPHPPSRHCMCAKCALSFEDDKFYIRNYPERIKIDPQTGDVEIVAPTPFEQSKFLSDGLKSGAFTIAGSVTFNPELMKLPERSEWVCYMFGTSKENAPYNVWYPLKNQVPNAFTRWMMKVCFACTWVKEKS